jgi:hypothetical protein
VRYLHAKPHVYGKFFDNFVNVGASFEIALDMSENKVYESAPFYYFEVEPRVQVNFSSNAYAAFAYTFRRQYIHDNNGEFRGHGKEPLHQTQWINLRFGIYF